MKYCLLYTPDVFFRCCRRRRRRRRRLKGIHSRPDTNRTGAEGLSFYYPRLLHCLDQMLAAMLLSQHRVSSSKTVRPRAPCGARCMGHIVSTWSAVCSEAPHSQFGEGARPHLCMDEWNRPTPVRRRLSLTQAARGKPIPTGLTLVPGTKARSLEAFSQYSSDVLGRTLLLVSNNIPVSINFLCHKRIKGLDGGSLPYLLL